MGSQTCDSHHASGLLRSPAVDAIPAGRSERAAGPALSVLHARGVDDAFEVIKVVRSNQAVLLNCSQLATRMGRRLIDICSGGVCAMDGQVHRISDELVLFAPALTRVTSA